MSDDTVPASSFDTWALPPQPPSLQSTPPVQPPRRASRPLTLALAMIATVLIGAGGGVAVAFATRSEPSPSAGGAVAPDPSTSHASALYQRALRTIQEAVGFKYVSVSTGAVSETFVGVAGQLGGRQDITFNSSYGSEHFTLLLVGTTVYFQGNTPALEDQLGVVPAGAPALAGKWVSVVTGNGPYQVLQPGITAAEQATPQQMPSLVPTSTTRLTTSDGTAMTRILGTLPNQPGTAHLDIVTSSGIPLSYVMRSTVNGTTATMTTTFSQWGTAPSVSAPSGAVAWSTLVTSPPPGGYGSGGASSASPSATPQPAI
jgi:hypothetical protein